MHDLGKLVYLDLQKTGSAYISTFLNQCCTLDLVKHQQHEIIADDFDPDAFYFISIRNPVDVYSSLFRYGKQNGGGMFKKLKTSGAVDVGKLYESFDTFCEFLLNPQYAPILDNSFTSEIAEKYGFASYRFLRLSLQYPTRKIGDHLRGKTSVKKLKKQFIHSLVIKNENLNEDLYTLSMNVKPGFFDPKKVESFLSIHERINASKVTSSEIPEIDSSLNSEILRKDAILLAYYS